MDQIQIQTKFRYFNSIRNIFENNEIIFDLPLRVYYWYKQHVKDNENITYEQAQKKLSRNIYLASECRFKKDENRLYFKYGNLLICLNKIGEQKYQVGYIDNNPKNYFKFYVDWNYRSYLNLKFSITEDKFRNKNKEKYECEFKYDDNYLKALEEMVFVIDNNVN